MLTKDHLKYRIRQSRVNPVFLSGTDEEYGLARSLVDVFEGSLGSRRAEIEHELTAFEGALVPAFAKLLWDRAQEEEEDPKIREFRWRAFELAEAQRSQFSGTAAEFRSHLAVKLGVDADELRFQLYSDLSEFKRIIDFKSLTAEGLVQRYNCAQIQGILLQAKTFTLDLTGSSIEERRALFRLMKFHRLLARVESDPKSEKLVVTLSGPLALFESGLAYGMRLAQFFPHILNLSRFALTAEAVLKKRTVTLKLDQSCGLKSHYKKQQSYVPQELSECLTAYTEKYAEKTNIRIEPNAEFLHLGKQSYCFPDLKFECEGKRYYIEFFHRWHKHQLADRLLAAEGRDDFILGVASQVLPRGQKTVTGTKLPHFVFREFPTAGQLKSAILSVTNQG